jgi:hypothetical protein
MLSNFVQILLTYILILCNWIRDTDTEKIILDSGGKKSPDPGFARLDLIKDKSGKGHEAAMQHFLITIPGIISPQLLIGGGIITVDH